MPIQDRVYPWLGHGRYLESDPTEVVDQQVLPFRTDAVGRLLVTTIGEAVVSHATASSTGPWGVSRSSPGVLGAMYASSLTEDNAYLQIFDLAAGPPAGGATPKHVFPLVAGAVVSAEPLGGLAFDVGITWAISSTAATYTAVAGSPAHVIAKHRVPA